MLSAALHPRPPVARQGHRLDRRGRGHDPHGDRLPAGTELDNRSTARSCSSKSSATALAAGDRTSPRASAWRSSKSRAGRPQGGAGRASWPSGTRRRSAIEGLRHIKEDIEKTKLSQAEEAERNYDLNRAAELRYGTLASPRDATWPGQRGGHHQGGSGGSRLMPKEEVGPDDVAHGHLPLDRHPRSPGCWRASARNCCAFPDVLHHERVMGPGRRRSRPWPTRCLRARAGLSRTPAGPSVRLFSSDPSGVGKDRTLQDAGRRRSSTPRRTWCAWTCPNTWSATPWPA